MRIGTRGRRRHGGNGRRAHSEPLEPRRLLSVTAASIAGPYDVAGTHWEYAATDGSGNTATLVETAAGPTTYNGNACYDLAIGPTAASHDYGTIDGAGDYVSYGGITVTGANTQTDVYSPYETALPAVMEAGTPYTSTYTDGLSSVNSATATTSSEVDTDTDVITLTSDSTSPIVVPAGTYDCYHLTDTNTTVSPNGDGTSSTDTTTAEAWYAPDVGMVKSIAYDDTGAVSVTYALTVFKAVDGKLAFLQDPLDVAVGAPIKPAVTVQLLDAAGNRQTAGTGSIILNLVAADSTGPGTLAGTLTEPIVGGVATFGDLSVDAGGSYTLAASDVSSSPATPAVSQSFKVTDGQLVFLKGPHDGTAGEPLDPGLTVELQDAKGNPITDEDGTTVTLATINVTGGATLTGNTAVLKGGVATFNSLTFKDEGFYTLQASDGGDADAASGKFTIAGDKLKFARQPGDTNVNTPAPLAVEIVDAKGKAVTDATTAIGLTLNIVTGHATAALAGTTTLAFAGGFATFTAAAGPKVNSAGTFTLTATELDPLTGLATSTTSPVSSGKFKVKGVTLRSITAAMGSGKQTSTDDDLAITAADVVAVPQSDGSMSLTGVGLSPSTPKVLAGIGWTVVRNADDVAAGAAPLVAQSTSSPLQATVDLNDGVGSFNLICYYDANGNGAYDVGEEVKVFHLAEVGVIVKPGGTEAANSGYFSQTLDGEDTLFNSGDFVSHFALSERETVQVVGGGADGTLGVSQVHVGFAQDGTSDTGSYHYQDGKTYANVLANATFPIIDSSYQEGIDNAYSGAIFGNPLGAERKLPNDPTLDPVIGTDPDGGQDRSVTTGDSPAIGAKTTLPGDHSPLVAADGTLGFQAYLAAYSDAFRRTYAGYLRVDWSATYQYKFAFTSSTAGNWQNTGSSVTATVTTLAAGDDLDLVDFVTSGPVYIHSESIKLQ